MVMVGGLGTLEGPLIGALLYFAADRLFSEYGASYMVALGLLTLVVALYARGGLGGVVTARFDWHWFPTRLRLVPQTVLGGARRALTRTAAAASSQQG